MTFAIDQPIGPDGHAWRISCRGGGTMSATLHAIPLAVDMLWADKRGTCALQRRSHQRFLHLVRHARQHSVLYQDLYAGSRRDATPVDLPSVNKELLNSRMDEWVCDPHLGRGDIEEHLSDPSGIGRLLNGKYFICTSSGTTGRPGVFIHDRRACAVYLAMFARVDAAWLSPRQLAHLMRQGGRVAAVLGTGGHFAAAAWVEFMRRQNAHWRASWKLISAQQPLDSIIEQLNAHDPAIVMIYPSSLELLIEPRLRGDLTIHPVLIEIGGENMGKARRKRAEEAFGCTIRTVYGASECNPISFSCSDDWLHYSSDWITIEPIYSDGSPTPVGEESDTLLITNLANFVAPIIRYDLGDSIVIRPDRCPCGSALPALRVSGRSDETLTFLDIHDHEVSLAPLALGALVDRIQGPTRTQMVQINPRRLALRMEVRPDVDAALVWENAIRELRNYLVEMGLANVDIHQSTEIPGVDPHSGKFRHIIRQSPA